MKPSKADPERWIAKIDEFPDDEYQVVKSDKLRRVSVLARDVIEACDGGRPHYGHCGCDWCAIYDQVKL